MTHHTPRGLPPLPQGTKFHSMDKDPASDGFMPFKVSPLKTWFTADQMQAYAEAYAREALAAQAATLEAICKIIECAGPEAADEIADLLGYPSVEWPSDQALTAPNLACKSAQARLATQWGYVRAASVEPVGKIINSGGNTGSLPEHPLLVWLGGVPPVGTELYASAPPSPANVPGAVEPLTKDDIDKLAEVLEVTSLDEVEPETVYAFTRAIEARFAPQPQAVVASSPSPASVQDVSLVEKLAKRTCEANADSARFTIALQTLRASLDPDDWMGAVTMHNYIDAVLAGGSPLQQHPIPSPAQAVMQVGCENIDGTLNIHPEMGTCSICEPAQAVDAEDLLQAGLSNDDLRAALQASSQPQAQQGGGENTARAFIEWCKAQPEDRVPVSIDEALNEFEAALATKEPK